MLDGYGNRIEPLEVRLARLGFTVSDVLLCSPAAWPIIADLLKLDELKARVPPGHSPRSIINSQKLPI